MNADENEERGWPRAEGLGWTSDLLDPLPPDGAIGDLIGALAKANSEIGHAQTNAENPHLKTSYADLASNYNAFRGIYAANGLTVIQRAIPDQAGARVQTIVAHTSGQWIADDGLFIPAQKRDPQGFGSALTYARRYGIATMVGLAQEDDDAEAAMKASKPKAKPKPKAKADEVGKPAREALLARIKALPEEHVKEISERLSSKGIVWENTSPAQHQAIEARVAEIEAAQTVTEPPATDEPESGAYTD